MEWKELYDAAKAVQNDRDISKLISAGGVAAAVESASGKIYTGVCVDTACTLGICAERNAIFNMITNGEDKECSHSWAMEKQERLAVHAGSLWCSLCRTIIKTLKLCWIMRRERLLLSES